MGLNPYGMAYHLGLQGAGTPRANPNAAGLAGFLAIADELGVRTLEIFDPWLRAMSDAGLAKLAENLATKGITPVVSTSLAAGPFDSAMRSAAALGATTIRLGLSRVLCGDRHLLGSNWRELVDEVRTALAIHGPRAADQGCVIAIENHQDFTSAELVDFCEKTRGIGICFDMGNTFPVAEAPLDSLPAVFPPTGYPRWLSGSTPLQHSLGTRD